MFAREYFESNLLEQGEGEYAPNFVITKLGAKTNRMMVAGLLEKMERQDTDNGAVTDVQYNNGVIVRSKKGKEIHRFGKEKKAYELVNSFIRNRSR